MQGLGLKFSSPHSTKAVQDVDLVVFSSAIRSTNVARAEAEKLGVRDELDKLKLQQATSSTSKVACLTTQEA